MHTHATHYFRNRVQKQPRTPRHFSRPFTRAPSSKVGDVELRHRTPSPMPRPDTPRLSGVANAKSLPWQPKVRQKDLENFLDQSRQKFVGYSVEGDQETMAGLPNPIHEGGAYFISYDHTLSTICFY